eukprot:GILJ01005966.1.p1 GENE.GILJ01005966.1~~GILJ01005966.1.p1  ORF type:complete len:694 (+),score=98.49 GILJ01005966.1:34-2115(+)
MSSRAARRLLQQRQQDVQRAKMDGPATESEESDNDPAEVVTQAPKTSSFAFLSNDSDDSSHETQEEEPLPTAAPSSKAQKTAPGGNKKGKKTASEKSNKSKRNTADDEDIDALLKDVTMASAPTSITAAAPSCQSCLKMEPKHFNPAIELRRLFGSRTVNDEVATRRQERNNRLGGRAPPGRVVVKRTMLVQPQDTWPRVKSGLEMETYSNESGQQYFKYRYSASYQEVQNQFEACVATFDPQNIANLVAHYPFHVDALLQLTEVYKVQGEFQSAAELIRRAVFTHELAWHTAFAPHHDPPNCRLDPELRPNQSFYRCLVRHIEFAGRQGCTRSATELSKLLIALLPELDPMGGLLRIDFYSLRAKLYDFPFVLADQFIGEFHPQFESEANFSHFSLQFLPNFAFNLSLAKFLSNEEADKSAENEVDAPLAVMCPFTAPLSSLTSTQLLVQALVLYPAALKSLLAKLDIKLTTREWGVSWEELLSSLVLNRQSPGYPWGSEDSIQHCIDIFVERNHTVWKSDRVISWVKKCAKTMVSQQQEILSVCEQLKSLTRAPFDLLRYRPLMVTDFSDSVTTLPQDQRDQFLRQPQRAGNLAAAGNPLLLFLQSLAPWNQVDTTGTVRGPPGSEAAAGAPAVDGGGFLDMIRQMLSLPRTAGQPGAVAGEAGEAGEAEYIDAALLEDAQLGPDDEDEWA